MKVCASALLVVASAGDAGISFGSSSNAACQKDDYTCCLDSSPYYINCHNAEGGFPSCSTCCTSGTHSCDVREPGECRCGQAYSSVNASSLARAVEVVGSCGPDQPSKVEDCLNVDFGSCGGACCKMDFKVKGSTDVVMDTLNRTMSKGGPDGAYELQMTAEGTLGFGDLTQFGSPQGTDWIGQAHHTTSGSAHYVDTLNFNIKKGDGYSLVRAFSVSQIGGALGDNGQNYKNLITVMKAAFGKAFKGGSVDGSCPAPALQVAGCGWKDKGFPNLLSCTDSCCLPSKSQCNDYDGACLDACIAGCYEGEVQV